MVETTQLPHLMPQNGENVSKERASFGTAVKLLFKRYYFLLFIPVIAFYCFACYQTEHALQTHIYNCFKQIGGNGFGVSYKPPHFAFLNTKLGLYVDDLVIKAPARLGGWTLKTGRLTVSTGLFTPDVFFIKAQGAHLFSTQNGTQIRFQSARADTQIRSGEKSGVTIEFENVTASGAEPFHLESLVFSTEKKPEEDGKTIDYAFSFRLDRFSMSAKNIALPAEIEFLYTTGKLRGFSGDPRRPLLDDWLNNGGTIDIEKGEMIWNPLMTEFSATVGLTPSLEPMVAAAAKTYGFFAFLSLLENRGALKNSDVSVAKIVLGKKLKMENGENQPSLTSSFSLQSGKLYVGQVLLYDFKK